LNPLPITRVLPTTASFQDAPGAHQDLLKPAGGLFFAEAEVEAFNRIAVETGLRKWSVADMKKVPD
jgi:hypothetical protein